MIKIEKQESKQSLKPYTITISVDNHEDNECLENIFHFAADCIWHNDGKRVVTGGYDKQRAVLKKLFDGFGFECPYGKRL